MFSIKAPRETFPNRHYLWKGPVQIGYYWSDTHNVSLIVPDTAGLANHVTEFLKTEGYPVACVNSAADIREVEAAMRAMELEDEDFDDDDDE